MKKNRVGILLVVAVAVALAAAGVLLLKKVIIPGFAVRMLKAATGLEVSVGRLDVGLLKPRIEVRDLRFRNPPGFPEADALEVRHLLVRYDRRSLFSSQVHLPEIALDIPRIMVVRRADGATNLDGLNRSAGPEGGPAEPAEADGGPQVEAPGDAPAGGGRGPGPAVEGLPEAGADRPAEHLPRAVKIDRLSIKFGDVEVRDYSRGGPEPSVMSVPLGVDREFENVTDLSMVGGVIAAEVLVKAMPVLVDEVGKLLKEAEDLDIDTKELKGAVKDLLKQLGL